MQIVANSDRIVKGQKDYMLETSGVNQNAVVLLCIEEIYNLGLAACARARVVPLNKAFSLKERMKHTQSARACKQTEILILDEGWALFFAVVGCHCLIPIGL